MFKVSSSKLSSFFSVGHERTVTAKKNAALSVLLKGGSVAISFILVPLTINYVNPTEYGIWLTLSSVISWFSFFDIGLGNGLKNKLAESNALGEMEKAKSYVSTTYLALTCISAIIFFIFLGINNFINWSGILNIPSNNYNLNSLAVIILGIFCIQFIVQLINVVLTACHEPAKVSLIALLGQLASLIVIFILLNFTEGSLFNLILALAGFPLLIMIIASVWFFKTKYSFLAPSLSLVSFAHAKSLLVLGGAFFFIQMGQLVLYQTDNIIIAHLFGPTEVTTFNIAYKLFSSVLIVFTIILTPLWSAFTDAYAKGDLFWIRSTFYKMQKVWLFTALLTLLLFITSPLIFRLWLNDIVQVPLLLSFFMALHIIGSSWHMLCCFLLNGINKIKLQLVLYIICFFINIPLALLLGKSIGLIGVVVANIFIFAFMGLLFYIQCHKILNGKATGIWNK